MGRMGTGLGLCLSAVSAFFSVNNGFKTQIFPGENIAYGGVASQSPVLWSYGPHLATDGNKQTCSFTTRKDGHR